MTRVYKYKKRIYKNVTRGYLNALEDLIYTAR